MFLSPLLHRQGNGDRKRVVVVFQDPTAGKCPQGTGGWQPGSLSAASWKEKGQESWTKSTCLSFSDALGEVAFPGDLGGVGQGSDGGSGYSREGHMLRPTVQGSSTFSGEAFPSQCSGMPQPGLWMALAPLLAALNAGKSVTRSAKGRP